MVDISVLISTYRRPSELRDAVRSVLCQRDVNLEVLVVDDCPDASARSVVSTFRDDRLIYLRMPKPTGGQPSVVRNVAWPRARGTFVHFLDDDDIVPGGHYGAVKKAFAMTPDVGVVFGGIEPFGDCRYEVARERTYFAKAQRRAAVCRRFGSRWGFAAALLFDATPLVCSAALIRRECVGAIDGFDPGLRVNEDVDFYARAIRRFGATFLESTSLYRRVGPSLIHQENVDQLFAPAYARMHAKYRAQWGAADFYALKGFARTVLKVM